MQSDREKPWTFDRWFEAQHGERPSQEDSVSQRTRVKELRAELRIAEDMLEDCEEWDLRRTSALWAWNVGPLDKA